MITKKADYIFFDRRKNFIGVLSYQRIIVLIVKAD